MFQCSVTCGEGFQIRNVECLNGVACTQAQEPGSVRECIKPDCEPLLIEETLAKIHNEIQPNLSNKSKPELQVNISSTSPRPTVQDGDLKVHSTETETTLIKNQKTKLNEIDDEELTNIEMPEEIVMSGVDTEDEEENTKPEANNNLNKTKLTLDLTLHFENASSKGDSRDLNLTLDSETQDKNKKTENENVRKIKTGLIGGDKEVLALNETKQTTSQKKNEHNLLNSTVGDSSYDSPDYEVTPDEYYEYDGEEKHYNRSLDSKLEGVRNSTSSEEIIKMSANDDISKESTQEETLEIDESNTKQDQSTTKNNETEIAKEILGNDLESSVSPNQNNTLRETINVSSVVTEEREEDEKILQEEIRNDAKKNADYTNNTKTEQNQLMNNSNYYNEEEYNYEDYHNFNNVFHDVDVSNASSNSSLAKERPQGYVEDKIDLEDVQVIEIKLKKSKSKKYRNREKIKKVKVHTGADALKVLNKFTKKANSKKAATPPLKSSKGEESFTSMFKWTIGPWMEVK